MTDCIFANNIAENVYSQLNVEVMELQIPWGRLLQPPGRKPAYRLVSKSHCLR